MKKHTLYSITNTINNKVYIGITIHLSRRINTHLYTLKKSNHGNKYIQIDYDKYGWDSFVVDVIDTYDNKFDAARAEKYFTDYIFRKNKDICYNIVSGGLDIVPQISKLRIEKLKTDPESMDKLKLWFQKANTGKVLSEETKNRIRQKAIGRKASKETKLKMRASHKGEKGSKAKKVIDVNTGIVYGCLKDASISLNINYDTLRARVNGYNNVKTSIKWL